MEVKDILASYDSSSSSQKVSFRTTVTNILLLTISPLDMFLRLEIPHLLQIFDDPSPEQDSAGGQDQRIFAFKIPWNSVTIDMAGSL